MVLGAEQRDVAERRLRARQVVEAVLVVVAFDPVAAAFDGALVLLHQRVLHLAGVAELIVEPVVTAGEQDGVLLVDGTTEPFVAIVEAIERRDVVKDGSRADAVHGEHVQLVVDADRSAGVLDAHVGQQTTRVVQDRVGAAAERDVRQPLREALPTGGVDLGTAIEDQATPVTLAAGTHGLVAGEDDRGGCRPVRHDARVAQEDQRRRRSRRGGLLALDGSSRIDGDGNVLVDERWAVDQVGALVAPVLVGGQVAADRHLAARRRAALVADPGALGVHRGDVVHDVRADDRVRHARRAVLEHVGAVVVAQATANRRGAA